MRWAGPAEEMESTCEEQAPEGTGEKQALEGAGEEWAPEGAGEEQALEGAGEERVLEDAGEEQAPEGAGEEQALEGARLGRYGTGRNQRGRRWAGRASGSGLEISQTLGHRLFPIQVGSVWELHRSMVGDAEPEQGLEDPILQGAGEGERDESRGELPRLRICASQRNKSRTLLHRCGSDLLFWWADLLSRYWSKETDRWMQIKR